MRPVRLAPLALLLAALSANAAPPPLADRLPADALISVQWKGSDHLGDAFEKSNTRGAITAADLPALFDKYAALGIEQVKKSDAATAARLTLIRAALPAVLAHPTAVAWRGTRPWTTPAEEVLDVPSLVLVCQAGDQADAVHAKLKELVAAFADGAPAPVATAAGHGEVLVQIGSADPIKEVNGAWTVGAPLSADPAYQGAMAKVHADPLVAGYVNIPAIVKRFTDDASRDSTPDEATAQALLVKALNLEAVGPIAWTGALDGKDWEDRAFIPLPAAKGGPRTGVLALIDTPPVSDDLLRIVPKEANLLSATRVDLARLFSAVRAVVAEVSPDAARSFDRGMAAAALTLGVDLEKDLLQSMGDGWVSYRVPFKNSQLVGMGVVMKLRNGKTFTTTAGTLEEVALAFLPMMNASMPPDRKITLAHTTQDGLDVGVMTTQGQQICWHVSGDYLLLAGSPELLPGMVARLGKVTDSILDNEQFAAAWKHLGIARPSTVEWSNLPAVLPETLVTLRGQVVMLRALGLPIPVDVVPSAEKLRPYLSVSTLGTWLDGDGWHARSVGPFPGAAMLGGQQSMVMVGVPVVTGAILLPSLGRAKVLANRSVDAAALSGIAKASVLYSVEHKDEAPPHLARLVAMQLIGPKQLVSRFSKTTPAVFTPEQLEAAFGDWTLIRDELDKHCDFIYVGAGSMAAVDSRSVIAYTKPGLDREGVNVAFEDGHVEYAKFGKRLQDMVAETNKLRAERKLQPIAIERPKAVGAQMAPAGPAR